jgi:phosphatidylglycerophosphate synthase
MTNDNFTGDKKAPMKSLLAEWEQGFIKRNIDKWPKWIETYHLTWMTLGWSAGLIIFGILATKNIHWLWASSVMLFLQWLTDSFDGAIGRARDTGLRKWGFFMDHFLDFTFMPSVFIGWSFLFDGINNTLMWFMSFGMGCLMVNAFLLFGATGSFKITYMRTGPTEMRLGFILINCVIIFFGTNWLAVGLPYIFGVFLLGIAIVVYQTQKQVWAVDMEDIKNRDKNQ